MKIIIVESPSKSTTIESYVGSDYKVIASNGHIRDLSTKGKAGLGIDIPSGFIPRYEILKDKTAKVTELKKACHGNEVFLATDPDREGEAISWHLACVLGLDVNTVNRVEFNEITKPAILEAFKNPRHIDLSLVQSQETRRMLDRIIGFQLSSLMQKKVKTKSAGRVQSSVLKLICDLEREIVAFVPVPYYEIYTNYKDYKINLIDDKSNIRKFDDKEDAYCVKDQLTNTMILTSINNKKIKQESKPALITSTLQQEASNRYGFSPDRTMRAAQSLYEGKEVGNMHVGLITYMRTDSTRLSDVFVNDALNYIESNYGKKYVGSIKMKKSTQNTQDAHEAIRPTSLLRTPYEMDQYLTPDERKIYRLVYNKTLASLMAPAIWNERIMLFDNNGYTFRLSGKDLDFDGFLASSGLTEDEKTSKLPDLLVNDEIELDSITIDELFTKPKARYTEATIIKAMEDLGIGRPSTYAQTIQKLKLSKYITIVDKKIIPTNEGFISVDKLQEFFPTIIAPSYTASMEEMLDKVASGEANNIIELQKFYDNFYPLFEKARADMKPLEAESTGELCPKCGAPLVKRVSKFGTFVSCSRFPDCDYKPNKEEPIDKEEGILCPVCLKGHIIQKVAKGKIFYACNQYPKCKNTYLYKPVNEYCSICGKVMMESPNGLICSDRDCGKTASNSEDSIVCPICGKGELVKRTSSKGPSKGQTFYACNRYPKCKTMYLGIPTGHTCGLCGQMMILKDSGESCSNPKCECFRK